MMLTRLGVCGGDLRRGRRWGLVCALIIATGGCFDEIIPNPGVSASESSGATTTTGSTGTASGTAATAMPEDGDTESSGDAESSSGSGSSTGGDADPLEGLCPGVEHVCEGTAWKIAPCEGCDELHPLAECVLGALAESSGGFLTTLRCEPECILDRYVLRPGGDQFMVESVLLGGDDEPVEIVGRKMCVGAGNLYFVGCLGEYSAECADPSSWSISCEDLEAKECPFMTESG